MIFDIFHSFPSAYPNNAECTWEITADNGYSIGLVFVDRFHLESSTNYEKDYVQVCDNEMVTRYSVIDLIDLDQLCSEFVKCCLNFKIT